MWAVKATWLALCLCVGVAVYSRSAVALTADRDPVGFEYEAVPELGCPTREELSNAVSRQLEYYPFSTDGTPPQQSVRAVISRTGGALEASIDWVDASGRTDGERRLTSEGEDCGELARGLVFALAVQIQLRASGANAQPKAPPPAPTAVVRKSPVPARPRPSPATRTWLWGLGPSLQRGWAPGTSFGLNALGALTVGRAWLEAGLEATAPTAHGLSDGTGFDGRIWRGWVSPCIRTPPFGWCILGSAGKLFVEGRGVDHPLRPSTWLLGAGGQVELLWPEGERFGVLLTARVLGTLTPRDVVLNEVAVWSSAPVALGLNVDLIMLFK